MSPMKATERSRIRDIHPAHYQGRHNPASLGKTLYFDRPGLGKSDHIVLFFLF
jgi:hypothetical protein